MTARLATALSVALGLLAPAALAAPRIDVCWDYGCDRQASVELPGRDWQRIRSLFAPPAGDPAAERTRIARAIALFEAATGRLIGTEADLGGNRAGSGRDFQMDCIDESRNTDTYLHVLEDHSLLHWHDVVERRKRAPWILDQHWTAVLRERRSGLSWAVDSWFLDNGRQPYIQRLEAWLEKADLPANPDAPRHDS